MRRRVELIDPRTGAVRATGTVVTWRRRSGWADVIWEILKIKPRRKARRKAI